MLRCLLLTLVAVPPKRGGGGTMVLTLLVNKIRFSVGLLHTPPTSCQREESCGSLAQPAALCVGAERRGVLCHVFERAAFAGLRKSEDVRFGAETEGSSSRGSAQPA